MALVVLFIPQWVADMECAINRLVDAGWLLVYGDVTAGDPGDDGMTPIATEKVP